MGGRKRIMDVSYELLHDILHLPEDIKVVGVWAYAADDPRHYTDVFRVKLTGECFGVVAEGATIPTISPTFTRSEASWDFGEDK